MEYAGRWIWRIIKKNVCKIFIEREKIQERFTTYKVQNVKHKFSDHNSIGFYWFSLVVNEKIHNFRLTKGLVLVLPQISTYR
jgi:hypothetical protein